MARKCEINHASEFKVVLSSTYPVDTQVIMQLESYFNEDLLRCASSFHISGDQQAQMLRVSYEIEDITLNVRYHRYIKDWRVAIDLEVENVRFLQEVYVENLAFKEAVRNFWKLIMQNDQVLSSVVQAESATHCS